MADFSLSEALEDDTTSQAKKISHTNPSLPAVNPPPSNPGWPGSAPGAPTQPSAPGDFSGLSGPGAPRPFSYPSGPGAPGQYPAPPSAPGGFPARPGIPGQYPPVPGAPGQFPSSPGAPGQFPGQYLPEGAPGQLPGGPAPYPAGPFPSGPGAPPGPYSSVPFPGSQPPGGHGMYGPGGPGAFPPPANPGSYPAFPAGGFPPIPPGSWGQPGGGFPPAPGPFGSGPGPMGPYGGPAGPGGSLPASGTFIGVGRCRVLLENEISISIKIVSRRKHEEIENVVLDAAWTSENSVDQHQQKTWTQTIPDCGDFTLDFNNVDSGPLDLPPDSGTLIHKSFIRKEDIGRLRDSPVLCVLSRFQVDFIKGSDVVFHLNPRFMERTIVRNSNLGGYWGPEEREGPFPFVEGCRFELKILVEEDMFKVAVDGTHLLEYEHRAGGLEEVTLLRVDGDVVLYSAAPSMI